MSPEKSLEYIKRWKALEGRRQELDYDVSRWCSDVRSEYPPGPSGDALLCKWVDVELVLSETRKHEILTRARAFEALPDRAQYEALGGYRHVRRLIPLNERERVGVVGEARASGKLIGGVLRARDEARSRRERYSRPAAPRIFTLTVTLNAREFAKWKAVANAADADDLEEWLKALGNCAAAKK